MNDELRKLLEICENLRHEIIHFKYSEVEECYIAIIKSNELGDRFIISYQDGNWVID